MFSGGGYGRAIGIIAVALGAVGALAGTGTTPFWSIGATHWWCGARGGA